MKPEKYPAVYIMANRYRGRMYVGVTSALYNRIADHKNGWLDGFTSEHDLKTLVWYAHLPTMEDAIRREKLLKKWHRLWKFRLIEALNPDWRDHHESIDANVMYNDVAPAPPRPALG